MIWCVEDDASTRDIEVHTLRATGFEARSFDDGTSFWEALQKERPQLVVLDVMLPGIDGIELLRRMRASSTHKDLPVIMATAKGQEFDKIKTLDMGADDYLVKPFSVLELVSRVKAVLRRTEPDRLADVFTHGDLVVNFDEYTVFIGDERIFLTAKEFALLRLLLSRPGTAFTREQIFWDVWETDYIGDSRTLDMHIRTLRGKLGPYASKIETLRNVGYRWVSKD